MLRSTGRILVSRSSTVRAPSRAHLVQATGSLPILLRSFVCSGSRCLRAVFERECLDNSSKSINDLYAPVFPSVE